MAFGSGFIARRARRVNQLVFSDHSSSQDDLQSVPALTAAKIENLQLSKICSFSQLAAIHIQISNESLADSHLYLFALASRIEALVLQLCFDGIATVDTEYWKSIKISARARTRYHIDVIPQTVYYWRVGLDLGVRAGANAWYRHSLHHAAKSLRVLESLASVSAYCISRIVSFDERLTFNLSQSDFSLLVHDKIINLKAVAGVMRQDYRSIERDKKEQLISSGGQDVYDPFTSSTQSLSIILDMFTDTSHIQQLLLTSHAQPSLLTRSWLPLAASTATLFTVSRYIFKYSECLSTYIIDSISLVRSFLTVWLIEPILEMLKTIRHGESRLALLGSSALKSDLESLERMVIDFARDQGTADRATLELIATQLQQGDLSHVLRTYEAEIKNPVLNLVTGDLVRALFIQIQKAKVDGEIAVSALDKLLKGNELNFAFLAVVPSVLLTYWAARFTARFFGGFSVKSRRGQLAFLRSVVWRAERIVVCAKEDNFIDHGRIVIECEGLRDHERVISVEFRTMFLQDLDDLERCSTTQSARVNLMARLLRICDVAQSS